MRKQSFFHPGEHHQRKLQSLGGVQGHERDLSMLIVLVGIADECGMIKKLIERLAAITRIHGGVYEFAQVLDTRIGFGRVFVLKLLDVAGAVDQEFKDLGGVGGRTGSTETFDRSARCSAGNLSAIASSRFGECHRISFGFVFIDCVLSSYPEVEAEI